MSKNDQVVIGSMFRNRAPQQSVMGLFTPKMAEEDVGFRLTLDVGAPTAALRVGGTHTQHVPHRSPVPVPMHEHPFVKENDDGFGGFRLARHADHDGDGSTG